MKRQAQNRLLWQSGQAAAALRAIESINRLNAQPSLRPVKERKGRKDD